jgi:hypothetical protein
MKLLIKTDIYNMINLTDFLNDVKEKTFLECPRVCVYLGQRFADRGGGAWNRWFWHKT